MYKGNKVSVRLGKNHVYQIMFMTLKVGLGKSFGIITIAITIAINWTFANITHGFAHVQFSIKCMQL